MNFKENVKRLLGVLSRPKTIATLQLAVAVVTLFHAVKRLRDTSNEEE